MGSPGIAVRSSLNQSLSWADWSCLWTFSGPGSVAHLTEQHLEAAAVDSEDTRIRFVVKRDPSVGQLQLAQTDNPVQISVKGPVKSFTQADINKGESARF